VKMLAKIEELTPHLIRSEETRGRETREFTDSIVQLEATLGQLAQRLEGELHQ